METDLWSDGQLLLNLPLPSAAAEAMTSALIHLKESQNGPAWNSKNVTCKHGSKNIASMTQQ